VVVIEDGVGDDVGQLPVLGDPGADERVIAVDRGLQLRQGRDRLALLRAPLGDDAQNRGLAHVVQEPTQVGQVGVEPERLADVAGDRSRDVRGRRQLARALGVQRDAEDGAHRGDVKGDVAHLTQADARDRGGERGDPDAPAIKRRVRDAQDARRHRGVAAHDGLDLGDARFGLVGDGEELVRHFRQVRRLVGAGLHDRFDREADLLRPFAFGGVQRCLPRPVVGPHVRGYGSPHRAISVNFGPRPPFSLEP
jgi:hypothetical protein